MLPPLCPTPPHIISLLATNAAALIPKNLSTTHCKEKSLLGDVVLGMCLDQYELSGCKNFTSQVMIGRLCISTFPSTLARYLKWTQGHPIIHFAFSEHANPSVNQSHYMARMVAPSSSNQIQIPTSISHSDIITLDPKPGLAVCACQHFP